MSNEWRATERGFTATHLFLLYFFCERARLGGLEKKHAKHRCRVDFALFYQKLKFLFSFCDKKMRKSLKRIFVRKSLKRKMRNVWKILIIICGFQVFNICGFLIEQLKLR
jgi:hypothetical protein